MYIGRRSLINNDNLQTSTNSIKQNYHINTTDNLTQILKDSFEGIYQTFLHSFINTYISSLDYQNNSLMFCPPIPPDLQGPITIQELPQNFSLFQNSSYHPEVQFGGHFHPTKCLARHKIAIIVPYRDREEILKQFLFHTHQI